MTRTAVLMVIAVLFAALLAVDSYQYDGYYRAAASDSAKQTIGKVERDLESWLGKDDR